MTPAFADNYGTLPNSSRFIQSDASHVIAFAVADNHNVVVLDNLARPVVTGYKLYGRVERTCVAVDSVTDRFTNNSQRLIVSSCEAQFTVAVGLHGKEVQHLIIYGYGRCHAYELLAYIRLQSLALYRCNHGHVCGSIRVGILSCLA